VCIGCSCLIALDTVSVPCSPVNTLTQAFNNPQVIFDDLVQKIHHPSAGELKVTGIHQLHFVILSRNGRMMCLNDLAAMYRSGGEI
jgi:crotonobetainyl-CoA:carnitine CoA-transferase CaiB-like acyl-CoA transferase